MFTKIKNKYKTFFHFKEKDKSVPLSIASIFFILILDILVFSSINMGIDFQTQVINNPSSKYSYTCREIIEESQQLLDYDYFRYTRSQSALNSKYTNIEQEELDQRCKDIKSSLIQISEDKQIQDLISNIKENKRKLNTIENRLSYIRNNYNTALFEMMAEQEENTQNLNDDFQDTKQKYLALKQEQLALDKLIQQDLENFKNNKLISNFYNQVTSNTQLLSDFEQEMKYYDIKKSVIGVLFLLPLLILFAYRMGVNNRNSNYNRYIITKNLFIVTLIPFTVEFLNMIWKLLPKVFLQRLLEILYNFNIPFVAYYILIGLFVIILTFIIIKAQNIISLNNKNLQKDASFIIKSVNKGKCICCSNFVNYLQMNYCSYCGNHLKQKCTSCHQETIKGLNYCIHCGEKNSY